LLTILLMLLAACGGDQLEGGSAGDEVDDTTDVEDTTDAVTPPADEGTMPTDDGSAADVAVEPGTESLDGAEITVGSKDFDEQLVLGNISRIALEAAGASVTDQINTGGTNAARTALTTGEIDHYWEYTGTAWISFFGNEEPIQGREAQYEAVREQDLEENNLVWLEPSPFNNTYAIAYRSEAAEELGSPETLSDLATIVEENPDLATLCVETEFASRNDGLPGMEEAYGFTFPEDNVTILDTGVVYSATDEGDPCNFGEVFATDGRVAALDLTVLEDDQGFFPLYNVSPVFRLEVYEQYGQALEDLFNPITETLTNEVMSGLNAQVSAENQRPEAVAQEFLESNDLLPQ
jgi:osmoprotectant transport system substrate-binding protein